MKNIRNFSTLALFFATASIVFVSIATTSCRRASSIVPDPSVTWEASWIGTGEDPHPDSVWMANAQYLRTEFKLSKKVSKATAHICGLGFYELYLNGERVGDKVLTPPVTNYDKRALGKLKYHYDDQSTQRCLYDTYDVTDMLAKGTNAAGIILGNGWYNQRARTIEGQMWYDLPRAIAQIDITYADGSDERICSDASWRISEGALKTNEIFTGETYDARSEFEGWARVGFDDSDWGDAKVVRAPQGALQPNNAPADKVIRAIEATIAEKVSDSAIVYSIPETIAGWAQIKVSGPAGSKVKLRFISEENKDYGQTDTYILKGEGIETWEPRFTWHTFRFIEVTSTDAKVEDGGIIAKEVRTDVRQSGQFECSDELLTKIFTAYLTTQEANMHGSLSSDCPHRERLGYTGDAQVGAPAALYAYDTKAFFEKWLNDMEDARNHVTGFVTHTAPFGGGGGGPAWGSAIAIIPMLHYQHYGDISILEDHYDAMKAWVGYLGTRTDERGIVVREEPRGWCLGDWCTPYPINLPEPLVNTCYWFRCADLASKTASLLGKDDEAASLRELCDTIARNFNEVFYNAETGHYWEGRQGSDILPFYFGMVPQDRIATVQDGILKHLEEIGWHFDTGILATQLVLETLTSFGHEADAAKVLAQRDSPGFGYLLDDANSTLWENWDGRDSHCHPMFGGVVSWLFSTLGGIDLERSDIAHGTIFINPRDCGLEWCKASYDVPQGTVCTDWKMVDGKMQLKVTLPKGLRAKVIFDGEEKEIAKTTLFR